MTNSFRNPIVLLTFSALTAIGQVAPAEAVPNQVFINQVPGNTFGTDLATGANNSDTLYAHISGGTQNHGFVTQNSSAGTTTGFGQYGSNNSAVIGYMEGTTNSQSSVYQGNAPDDAAVNHFVVNVANDNNATALVAGSNQTSLVVQKGNENTSSSVLAGGSSNLTVIQEMHDAASPDVVDAQGNHFRGGNDSTVAESGNNNSVSVNQYQGNVSKITTQGTGNSVNVTQANNLFTPDRRYNNVNLTNQNGVNLHGTVNQNGAGELVDIIQTGGSTSLGGGNSATVTQTLGGSATVIIQAGTGETATVNQSGTGAVTNIVSGTSSANNHASVTQSGGIFTAGNTAILPQSGIGNSVIVQQVSQGGYAGYNYVSGTTNGNNLNSILSLGPWPTPANPGNAAWVGQQGNNNTYTLTQQGMVNLAFYQQAGDRNTATVTQQGDLGGFASTDQIGNDNTMNILQAGASNNSSLGSTNIINALQLGNNDEMDVSQVQPLVGISESNRLSAVQYNGNNNIMKVTQTGANLASLSSSGSGNSLTLAQNNAAGGYTLATQNVTGFSQIGNNNTADISEVGTSNLVNVSQQGSGLNMTVTQNGSGHQVQVTQTAANPNITIHQ